MSRNKTIEFEIDEAKGTVKAVIVEHTRWGTIKRRTQHTLSRRQFESALRIAKMSVPWDRITR